MQREREQQIEREKEFASVLVPSLAGARIAAIAEERNLTEPSCLATSCKL